MAAIDIVHELPNPYDRLSGLREAGDHPARRAIPSAGSVGAGADRNPEIHVLSMVRSLSDRRARGAGRLPFRVLSKHRSNDTERLPLRRFCQDCIIATRGYDFRKGQEQVSGNDVPPFGRGLSDLDEGRVTAIVLGEVT